MFLLAVEARPGRILDVKADAHASIVLADAHELVEVIESNLNVLD